MRERVLYLMEAVGFGCIIGSATIVAPWLGLFALGALLVLGSWVLSR